MNFILELGIKDMYSLNSILYVYLFSFFNFYSFMFVDNMNLWVLMAEIIGLMLDLSNL